MIGRDAATNEPIADPTLFPSGMKALGDYIHSLEVPGKGRVMKYGLYTSRGSTQCSRPEYRKRCLHTPPNPPACEGPHPTSNCGCAGSKGHERGDARWFAAQGIARNLPYLPTDIFANIHPVVVHDKRLSCLVIQPPRTTSKKTRARQLRITVPLSRNIR